MVEVHEYDPGWPERFDELRSLYVAALDRAGVPYRSIEHVGSTSVPGLAAKPVIDVDIVVDEEDVEAAADVLVSLGFSPRGEVGIPLRWAFWEPERLAGTNTYVVVHGSLALRNHLALRATLIADPDLRDEYARIKREAGRDSADIYEYGARKGPMILKVLGTAGLTIDEIESIAENNVPRTERPA